MSNDDFFKRLIAENVPNYGPKGSRGLQLRGYVIRSSTKTTEKGGKTTHTSSYLVIIQSLPSLDAVRPDGKTCFRLAEDGTSLRFIKSDVSSTHDDVVLSKYMEDIGNYNTADVVSAETPVNLRTLPGSRFTNEHCYRFNLDIAPYNTEPITSLKIGDAVWISTINSKAPVPGTLIDISDVGLNIFFKAPVADSKFTQGPPPRTLLQLKVNAASFKAVADVAETERLPHIHKLMRFIDFGAPFFDPLTEPSQGSKSHVFGIYLSSIGTSRRAADSSCGRLLGPNVPGQETKDKTQILKDNPQTYRMGDVGNRRKFYPANVLICNWQTTEAGDVELSNALRRNGYTADKDTDAGATTWIRKYSVRFDIWSENIQSSGISDFKTWCNVNSQAPVNVGVLAILDTAKATPVDVILKTQDVAWDMPAYLDSYGIEVSHSLAFALLGSKLECNLGMEIHENNGKTETYPIVNIPNLEFAKKTNEFLVNLSEWNGPAPDLSDPNKKWKTVLLIVPNAIALEEKKPRLDSLRAKATALLEASRVDGVDKDELINKFIRGNTPPDSQISELGGLIGDFTYVVFGIRDVISDIPADVLNTRFYTPAKCILSNAALAESAKTLKRQRDDDSEKDVSGPGESDDANEADEPPSKRLKSE